MKDLLTVFKRVSNGEGDLNDKALIEKLDDKTFSLLCESFLNEDKQEDFNFDSIYDVSYEYNDEKEVEKQFSEKNFNEKALFYAKNKAMVKKVILSKRKKSE